MSESEAESTGGGGNGLLVGGVAALTLLAGAIPLGVAFVGGEEEESADCEGPNAGQALTVVEGNLPIVDGYTPAQISVAAVIMQTAEAEGLGSAAQIIGLITAQQESTMGINTQPTGAGDAGPFQQRTLDGWYGSLEQVNDVAYAARAFFKGVTAQSPGDYGSAGGGEGHGHLPGLVDIDGWEAMAPGDAAQAVQRSAHPGAYAAHVDAAQRLMTALSGVEVNIDSTATMCSAGDDVAATGDAKAAIERGRGLLGTPYEFGGGGAHGPDTGIDCSGFIQYMLPDAGLPRMSQQQFDALSGSPVEPSQIQPGDLIFYAKGRTGAVGSPNGISHVSMYSGNGKMIESTRYNGGTEPGVQEVDAQIEGSHGFVGVRRVPGLSTETTN